MGKQVLGSQVESRCRITDSVSGPCVKRTRGGSAWSICITEKDLNQTPKARRILKLGFRSWVKSGWVGLSLTKGVSPEAKLVHGNGKVAGLVTTTVQIAVIHRDQVHITEDEAVIGSILFQCL